MKWSYKLILNVVLRVKNLLGRLLLSAVTSQQLLINHSLHYSAVYSRIFIWDRHYFLRFIGRPFVKRLALCYQTADCPVCPVYLSVTLMYCGQTVEWIKMKLGMEVGRPWPHCVRWGIQLP